jgi:hypothetical protein
MIALSSDCLMFQLASGERVPFSAAMISVELEGETTRWFDSDLVENATRAVFHYFKEELGRETVTLGEFAEALETVLQRFANSAQPLAGQTHSPGAVRESDLRLLAGEAAEGCELFFFPRLRAELREHLQQQPRMLKFRGLRGCVKRIAGAQRWNLRCRNLEERIVEYLRECLSAEPRQRDFSMVVG